MIAVSPDENKKDKQVCNHAKTNGRSNDVIGKKNILVKFKKGQVAVFYQVKNIQSKKRSR